MRRAKVRVGSKSKSESKVERECEFGPRARATVRVEA